MPTEYDNIDVIGTTHEIANNYANEVMNRYYHKQEVTAVSQLIKKWKTNFDEVLDFGYSIGTWYNDFKKIGFKKIIGIDISSKRLEIAKKRGYETYKCNAYDLPFEDNSKNIIISSDVLVHVLQDDDKIRIFKEIKRVLKKDGIFIFNFANASGFGFNKDTTVNYCRMNTLNTIKDLLKKSELQIHEILPSYSAVPRIGANPKVVSFSTKVIFPFTDYLLKKIKNYSYCKYVYVVVKK